MEVSSGIDWFELRGGAAFGNTRASLPRLLAALRQGRSTVTLSDGTIGIMPDSWSERLARCRPRAMTRATPCASSARRSALLDALLAAMPATSRATRRSSTRAASFTRSRRSQPADPPETFDGELRTYQRDGLGWLHFLSRFGFGGCLADDMGLGKTVQVLALLEERATRRRRVRRSSSCRARWCSTGGRRRRGSRRSCACSTTRGPRPRRATPRRSRDYDLVLTPTARCAATRRCCKDVEFDYVILDEAQAIKNAATESAKAARLLARRSIVWR